MRYLIVGAGALGGYFGGRMIEAGLDVTFLVRPGRAALLKETGLLISSSYGDLSLPSPPTVLSGDLRSAFDIIVVGCKAYDLATTIESFAAAVGPQTMIFPVLNGLCHLDRLAERFGPERVIGGVCMISATLDGNGTVLHLSDMHRLSFGELDGSPSNRILALEGELSNVKFEARRSAEILQELWEKWVFIAAVASITCLMRASVGDIISAGAGELASRAVDECAGIAARNGFAPRQASIEQARSILTQKGSTLTASMFKDIERNAAIEGDHIVGDLLRRDSSDHHGESILRLAYTHLRVYEARRARLELSAVEAAKNR